MTATPAINGAYRPVNEREAIPAFTHRKLAANAQIGRGQFATVSLSTGFAALNDGTVPGQASCGSGDPAVLSDTDATAGNAQVRLSQRWIKGIPASTLSNDGFADTDYAIPFWIANENTPGKLSNQGGNNRSLGGLVFGLDADGNPILWDGPVAWLLARGTHAADNNSATIKLAADGAANTATAETQISRDGRHGVIVGVFITFDAAVTADNTNNAVITIKKRDGAGGAAVTVATLTTNLATGNATAFVPLNFGALTNANLLEGDVLTVTVAKGGAGVQLPASVVRVAYKVI